MITESQVTRRLMDACSSFHTDEELLYVALGDFARHLLALQQQGQTTCFPAVAKAIEELLLEGTSSVKEAAVVGLLEGIQNNWGHAGADTQYFCSTLLPESRRWWNELEAFWRGERRYVGEGFQKP